MAELARSGVKIRSRALVTTLWARMVLGDLFIHGIGGGNYDLVTDRIIERFFGRQPPGFMILSATLHLPINQSPLPTNLRSVPGEGQGEGSAITGRSYNNRPPIARTDLSSRAIFRRHFRAIAGHSRRSAITGRIQTAMDRYASDYRKRQNSLPCNPGNQRVLAALAGKSPPSVARQPRESRQARTSRANSFLAGIRLLPVSRGHVARFHRYYAAATIIVTDVSYNLFCRLIFWRRNWLNFLILQSITLN